VWDAARIHATLSGADKLLAAAAHPLTSHCSPSLLSPLAVYTHVDDAGTL
jgi:hypothetical protein